MNRAIECCFFIAIALALILQVENYNRELDKKINEYESLVKTASELEVLERACAKSLSIKDEFPDWVLVRREKLIDTHLKALYQNEAIRSRIFGKNSMAPVFLLPETKLRG